ncbi:MAG: ABC-F family ATP-binding cassette domain-containing protein [Solirubrobacteraceae bacterium]|nr:ABC-F family ATP-binding cassette domain-containing protein [Solirubrobacteraceae bacterium]
MSAPARNLVNLKSVTKGYASRNVLSDVTLGISAGDRIGIVGRNGDGKSTLLKLIAGLEQPDSGQVTQVGTLHMAIVAQGDDLDPAKTIRDELVGGRADHEWAGDPKFRSVLEGLLGGVEMRRFEDGLDTVIGPLSGGERRRIALAKLLLDTPDLLLLDEPTNHLDVEGVEWLARHLASRRGSLIVITHDRWFLDAVCTHTWEVSDGDVYQYEGGYAAYVLARAERDRQAGIREDKRQQLVKKELAWLRRGPPARTSKPKFRIDAANALIADVPEPRDGVELLRFANARLGNKVLDAVEVSVAYGEKVLLKKATWRLGPGDRVALVGVNGSGKTTMMNLLGGITQPTEGVVERGQTVKLAYLSQDTAEIPGHLRVLESLEAVRGRISTSDGQELTAGMLCDRFGFRGARARTFVKDLSGGERRRLQLMRLLMEEPNVLLLDEPTNDLDIDTLTAMEDLLDSWPGTLVVVSHDRYFVERVCDNVYALSGNGGVSHLPGGIDQYIEQRKAAGLAPGSAPAAGNGSSSVAPAATGGSGTSTAGPSNKEIHAARKEVQRLDRAMEKLTQREAKLYEQMAESATDPSQLRALGDEQAAVAAERDALEALWLEASEIAEA